MLIQGTVVAGKQIAQTTIPIQKHIFSKRIPTIYKVFDGTINLSLLPHKYELIQPDFSFENIQWSNEYPIEDFTLIRINNIYRKDQQKKLTAFIYIPSKSPHTQNRSQIEIVSEEIKDLGYGETLTIEIDEKKLELSTI